VHVPDLEWKFSILRSRSPGVLEVLTVHFLYIYKCHKSFLEMQEKFEDTKEVIRRHKSKDNQYNGQKKKDKNDK